MKKGSSIATYSRATVLSEHTTANMKKGSSIATIVELPYSVSIPQPI